MDVQEEEEFLNTKIGELTVRQTLDFIKLLKALETKSDNLEDYIGDGNKIENREDLSWDRRKGSKSFKSPPTYSGYEYVEWLITPLNDVTETKPNDESEE